MSKRAWYNCNERKAKALLHQGYKVRIEPGRWQYKRPVKQTKRSVGSEPSQKRQQKGKVLPEAAE